MNPGLLPGPIALYGARCHFSLRVFIAPTPTPLTVSEHGCTRAFPESQSSAPVFPQAETTTAPELAAYSSNLEVHTCTSSSSIGSAGPIERLTKLYLRC